MISIKSQYEIDLMREAGRISNLALWTAGKAVRPGITTLELDQIAEEAIRSQGAVPNFKGYDGFPGTICASINNVLVHGIPGKTVLKLGDIITIDTGAMYKGYNGDNAWTFKVGEVSDSTQRLMDVTLEALYQALAIVKPGIHLSDISHTIGEYVYAHGYTVPYDYTGHGIGTDMHEDPSIPNFGNPGKGPILKEGMCLAIEPMVHAGRPQTRVKADGWTVVTRDKSLSAHYEHSIVITKDGCEILTQCEESLEKEWVSKMSSK